MPYQVWIIILDWIKQSSPYFGICVLDGLPLFYAAPCVYQLSYPGETPVGNTDLGLGEFVNWASWSYLYL